VSSAPTLPRTLGAVVDTAVVAAATAVAVPAAYLTVVSAAALAPRRAGAPRSPQTRFAILVPAHDEAAVIGEALAAFDRLDYPLDLFSVHVVADNCTDATADIVAATHWTVYRRDAPDDAGKGPALNWLFDRLTDAGDDSDAVVIVDADTSLAPGFLRAMDAAVQSGAAVAQGYYSVREPEPTPATSFRFAALACRHRLRPLGRTRLGGSCGLYGNGMMFRRELLATRRWSGHLVEDAEMQNELLLDGIRVAFAPDAVLWAEMPTEASAARTQNERWERGRIEVARRFVPQLLRGLPRAGRRRAAYADAVLDHLTPPLSALVAGQLAVAALSAAGAVAGRRRARTALAIDVATIAAVAAHVLAGLVSARATPRHYRALLAAPRQIAWKTMLWLSVLRRRDVGWTRTRRNAETDGTSA